MAATSTATSSIPLGSTSESSSVGVPVLLRRRRPGDVEVAGFAAAMILFQIVIIFTIPELVYRYEYPIVVAGTVVFPVLLPWRRGSGRGERGQTPTDRACPLSPVEV